MTKSKLGKKEFWGTKERLDLLREMYVSDSCPADIIAALGRLPGPSLPIKWTTIADYAARHLRVRRTNPKSVSGFKGKSAIGRHAKQTWQQRTATPVGDEQKIAEHRIRVASDRFAKAVKAPLWTSP